MTLHNLHTYHTTLESFKLLKYRTPISLHSLFQVSTRKESLLIKPKSSHHFIFTASDIWNLIRQKIKLLDISLTSIGQFKASVRGLIMQYQKLGSTTDWTDNELDVTKALRYNCGSDFVYSTDYDDPMPWALTWQATHTNTLLNWSKATVWHLLLGYQFSCSLGRIKLGTLFIIFANYMSLPTVLIVIHHLGNIYWY